MSVYFFINDINNLGSITVEQALNIGQYFSQYVLEKDSEEYSKFLKERLADFECILLGIEGESARGFELSYDSNKKCYIIRLLIFSSTNDYLGAFDYIKKLCDYLGNNEIITDENKKYTPQTIKTYDFKRNIKYELATVYSELLKSGNDEAYFEFKGIHRNVALNVELIEQVIMKADNIIERFDTFITGLQYIKAHEAKQKLYQSKDGVMVCSYTLTETVPTVLPFNPSIDYENKDIVKYEDVALWVLNIVIINGNPSDLSSYETLGQIDYQDFIKRLPEGKYGFIDAKYILVQPLNVDELRQILNG